MSELEGLCQCMGQCCLAIGQLPFLGHCHECNQGACLLLVYLIGLGVGIGGTSICYERECGYEPWWVGGTIVWFLYGMGVYVYWEVIVPWYQSKVARATEKASEAFTLLPGQDRMQEP